MNFDERIQNLTQQINIASREVIIQDRILGQHRERVAELQGRINMLMEMQEKDPQLEEHRKIMEEEDEHRAALAGKSKQPKKKK